VNKIDMARDLVQRIPNAPARTLARRLVLDFPDVFPTVESARTIIRNVLDTHGTQGTAKKSKLPRGKRQAGWKPEFPPTSAEPWTPYELPTPCCVLSLSDFHVPYHDQAAIVAAVRHAKRKHRITHLVLNGDYMDFYRLSRFQRNPLKRSLHAELATGRDGLVWLAGEFKKQELVYKRGNHDERWNAWCWNHAPEMADCEHMQLSTALKLANYGYTEVGDEPIMAGKLPILHGHELGNQVASPVNPARGAFMRTLYTVLVAHSHQTSTHSQGNIWHEEMAAFSQGCLCDLTPEYARVNKWNHGFAVIEVEKDGMFNLTNYRVGTGGVVRTA
jgi:predicted phosphodiesterase